MNNIVTFTSTHAQTAQQYAKIGWHIFPCWWIENGKCACNSTSCKSPGKHPIFELAPRGQKDATCDVEKIRNWWSNYPRANIAVFLAQSGLCAVDIDPRNGGDFTIDDLEARHGRIESDVVALTGGGGEHRIFQRPDGDLPGKLGDGVDLKLNGYIIVEPSNHISGVTYQWENSSNPLEGAIASPLPDWIRSLSTRHSGGPMPPASFNAPECTLADWQVRELEQALEFINSDDRDTWTRVGMALHATGDNRAYGWWSIWSQKSSKFDSRDQFRVWRSFRFKGLDGYSIATVFAMARANGWISAGLPPDMPLLVLNEPGPETVAAVQIIKDGVPEHLLHLPVKNLEALAYWINGFSEEPQRQIVVQSVLSVASVLASRIYLSTSNNPSNCYFLTLAGTGIGKNYVKSGIRVFLTECGQAKLLSGSGNTSAGAVFSALFDSPKHIQITDEFGKHLQMARKQSTGAMADAFAVMTEAYSDSAYSLTPRNYSSFHLDKKQRSQLDKKVVFAPSITMLAFATPEQVYQNLTSSEIDDGYLNRFILVEADEPCLPEQDICVVELPEELKAWANSICNREPEGTSLKGVNTDYDQAPVPVRVPFSPAAKAAFDDFKREIRQGEKDGAYIEPKLVKRWRENAMRLSVALAVCDEPENPMISERIALWCIDYVRFYGQRAMNAIASKVADSEFHDLYLKIKELVGNAGAKGMSERDLSKFSRRFAATPPHQRDQALSALIREGIIQQVTFKTVSGRGKPRVAFVACEFIEDDLT